jgi:NAD-dependent deacetylase
MKNIVFFTGAGVSAESGVSTFRTGDDGLWYNHKVEDVATIDGWKRNKEKVLNFYNERRSQLKTVNPNLAHQIISELQKDFNVTVITQNVDNLHERAGSMNVIHLHGELTKVRSTVNPSLIYDWVDDCNIGHLCENNSQLRPHIVWFGEELDNQNIKDAVKATQEADVFVIIGSSMQVAPANTIPFLTKETALIYYIDPGDIEFGVPKSRRSFFYHFQENATTGMEKLKNEIKEIFL